MNNASAQVVGYVGSSICNLLKLEPHLTAMGLGIKDVVNVTMQQLNEQLGHRSAITGGLDVSAGESLARQHGGVEQNSGLSGVSLA